MKDIVEALRAECNGHEGDLRWQAAAEIERLQQVATAAWAPMANAPKDEGPLLLVCPGLAGHVADEIVVGTWRFDANRRALGYWVSDVGQLDPGFAETGPWIEYHELTPQRWARLPARPAKTTP